MVRTVKVTDQSSPDTGLGRYAQMCHSAGRQSLLSDRNLYLSSSCCCNRLPQTWGLKTIQIYQLLNLEVKGKNRPSGLKPGCWRTVPLWRLQGRTYPWPFSSGASIPWLIAPSSILKSHPANLCFHQDITSPSHLPKSSYF